MSESHQRSSVKRRLDEIEDTLEHLSRSVSDLSDFSLKAKIEHKITTIRLKKEKTQALAAVARSQNLLAEMEIMIAENEVNNEIEKLKTFKKIKLDCIYNNPNKGNSDKAHTPSQIQADTADKSSQTKKTSSKIKSKKTDVNKKTTYPNNQKPNKDYNNTPELNNPLPVPNNTELKNKTFENRMPPSNSNSLFENLTSVNNNLKVAKVPQTNKIAANTFKKPINGQKNTNRTAITPANVSRHILPAVISQPRYRNKAETTTTSHGTPYKIIYGDETVTAGGDLFNRAPEPDTNDANLDQEMINDFFRELMYCKRDHTISTPVKKDGLETSMNSATTIKLEELLSS